MRRCIAVVILIIITSSITTGCWSKKELNEIAIASGIGIDKIENNYYVSVQIVNPGEVASTGATGQRASIVTYRTEGKTIAEALRRMTTVSTRRIYLSHLRVIVFGIEVAEEGVGKTLDFLLREHEMRTNVYVVIAKEAKVEDILSIQTTIEKISANKIYTALESSDKLWGATHSLKLDELINSISSKGKNAVVTSVILKGNHEVGMNKENIEKSKPPTTLELGNSAVFKKDKLVGWLNESESMEYSHITDNTKGSVETINCQEGGNISIEIIRTKSTMKAKIENGNPKIDVVFQAEGNVSDVQCDIDLTKFESISKLEKQFETQIKKRMEDTILKAQKEFKSDIFGFGEEIRRSHPKEWKKLEKNWDDEFSKLQVKTKVVVKIKGVGTITKPIPKEIKE